AVGEGGGVAAAATEHPHLRHLGVEGGTGDAVAVVGQRRDGARDVGAMPARRVSAVVVTRVGRVGIRAIAVATHGGIVDHVVAGDGVAVEIAVAGAAGGEDRDHHACAAAEVPGLVGADAAGGIEVAPLLAVARIVGGQGDLQQAVDLDVLDVGVGRYLAHQALGLDAVELAAGGDDVGADAHAAGVAHGQAFAART